MQLLNKIIHPFHKEIKAPLRQRNISPLSKVSLVAASVELPSVAISTESIIESMGNRISDDLVHTIKRLGVHSRHSVVNNYNDYLAGKVKRELIASTTSMAVSAAKKCLASQHINPDDIGLVIALTNTANRPLPCLAYEIVGQLNSHIPNNINVLNMQNQGCAAVLKAFDFASCFMMQHPDKLVLVVVSEAHTALADNKKEPMYYGYHELSKSPELKNKLIDTQQLVESLLFGDGAAAFVLSNDQAGEFLLGPFAHLTNIEPTDTELLTINQGGALLPVYEGFPYYYMSSDVPKRGVFYAAKCVEALFTKYQLPLLSVESADNYFIHTGSKLILDKICSSFHIGENDNDKRAKISYEILEQHGNLSSCSIAFMLAHAFTKKVTGTSLIISFGVGFSATTTVAESHAD